MIYTVKLDLCIDDDNILEESVLIGCIKEVLRCGNIDLEDGQILDIND